MMMMIAAVGVLSFFGKTGIRIKMTTKRYHHDDPELTLPSYLGRLHHEFRNVNHSHQNHIIEKDGAGDCKGQNDCSDNEMEVPLPTGQDKFFMKQVWSVHR
jgi:hypothetical protein